MVKDPCAQFLPARLAAAISAGQALRAGLKPRTDPKVHTWGAIERAGQSDLILPVS